MCPSKVVRAQSEIPQSKGTNTNDIKQRTAANHHSSSSLEKVEQANVIFSREMTQK